jgi:hypothetical protein
MRLSRLTASITGLALLMGALGCAPGTGSSGTTIASSKPGATQTPVAEESQPAVVDPAHYPPVLPTDASQVPPTREQQMWALATCALLTESNGGRHDLLGGFEPTSQNAAAVQQLLSQWWGIENRDQLLETLAWIEAGGHRRSFDEIAAYVTGAAPDQMQQLMDSVSGDPELQNQVDVAVEQGGQLAGISISGWDYSRYIWLCGQGYVAGYLTEAEAWSMIMPAARALQSTFDSWQDLSSNYLVGRRFWSYSQTLISGAQFTDTRRALLVDADSPWVVIPWDTDLGGTGGNQ